jgi:hypothetical protein
MTTVTEQKCPLCHTISRFESFLYNEKYFSCPVCTGFIVHKKDENSLSKQSLQVRTHFSNFAKQSNKDYVCLIKAFPIEREQTGMGHHVFHAELIKGQELWR